MFTIAIPAYKYKEVLKDVLRSINRLDRRLLGNVVVYLEPTEDSVKIINCLNYLAVPVTVIQNPVRKGMVENFNQCILKCKNPWLIINHDDDILLPGILNRYAEIFLTHPKTALISSEYLVGTKLFFPSIDNLKKVKRNLKKRIVNRSKPEYRLYNKENYFQYICEVGVPACSSVAFNFNVLKDRNKFLFDDQLKYSPDEELWPRMLMTHTLAHVNHCMVKRSIDNTKCYEFATWEKEDFLEQYFSIRRMMWEYSQWNPEVRKKLNESMQIMVAHIYRHIRKQNMSQSEALDLYETIMNYGGRKIG